MAGLIKFAERTRSLQLASLGNFRQSMVHDPDPGPNYAKLMDELKSRREAGLPAEIVTMPEISNQFLDVESEQSDAKPDNQTPDTASKNEIDDHSKQSQEKQTSNSVKSQPDTPKSKASKGLSSGTSTK